MVMAGKVAYDINELPVINSPFSLNFEETSLFLVCGTDMLLLLSTLKVDDLK